LSATAASSPLAPFGVRSFRFQWPADLATSWAFEMETLILGWYILVETGSVLLLTLFASVLYIGTLLAPLFGVAGHRLGDKNLLCMMRVFYAVVACVMLTLALTGALSPLQVIVMAFLNGLVRPSDISMRFTLIGNTMPPAHLMGAMSASRTTQDSARIMGALTGAGVVAALGMAPALAVIVGFYVISVVLTLGVSNQRPGRAPAAAGAAAPSPWRDLKDALAHVWTTPRLLAVMCLAFLFNLTAFSMVMGLLPYVAKEIYGAGQTGLGYLVASFAFGSVIGTAILLKCGHLIRPARMMIICCVLWHLMIFVFGHMQTLAGGIVTLVLAGIAQSLCTIPLSVMLLRTTDERFRGRVMGVRILAIYGLPIGLMIAGQLVPRIGYAATTTIYCVVGLAVIALITLRWREHLWRLDAPANRR
jgi:predicted MFS family arabinose efflux permease